MQPKKGPRHTPKRLNKSIKKDPVHPGDYMKFKLPYACEDCTHFDHVTELCTIGYQTSHHRRAEQLREYMLSGRMALCRFQEID